MSSVPPDRAGVRLSQDPGRHTAARGPGSRTGATLAIVALALALRLAAGLATPSVGRDEANDVFVSREAPTVRALLETLRVEGSPPLRFLLVERPLHRAFPSSVWPVRLAEILLGTAAVAVVIAVGGRAFGEAVGLATGLVMATAPYFVHASVNLRSQSLHQLLAAAYALALVRLLDGPGVRGALAGGVLGGLLMLTHYYGGFVVGTTLLFGLAWRWRAPRTRAMIALAGAAAMATFLPWMPFLFGQLGNPLRPGVEPRHSFLAAIEVMELPLGPLGIVVVPACLVLWAWLGARARTASVPRPTDESRRSGRNVGLFVTGALGSNLAAWFVQWVGALHAPVHPRYLAGAAVWLVPLLGGALDAAARSGRRGLLPVTAGLVVGSLVSALPGTARPPSSAPQVARTVEAHGQPGDLILFTHASIASVFNFYYRGDLEEWAVPFRGRITHVPWAEVSARLEDQATVEAFERDLIARLDRGGRVWLIASKQLPATPDAAWAAPAPAERHNPFLRARNGTHRRLLRILYTHGRPVLDYDVPPGRALEPLGVVLFLPASPGR
jgi:MFS family permease